MFVATNIRKQMDLVLKEPIKSVLAVINFLKMSTIWIPANSGIFYNNPKKN